MLADLYPEVEPYDSGMLDVGQGHSMYWEACGYHAGKPALFVHGGPGVGCAPWHRRLFDPSRYRILLFDQRGCGRSTPHASDPGVAMTANTTWHLVADMERLREHMGIDRWLVLGGSWGSCLALAYAERHPRSVSELVLTGVFTARSREFDWFYGGGVAPLFPEEWESFLSPLPANERDGDLIDAYARLFDDPSPAVRSAARDAWLQWEMAAVSVLPDSTFAETFSEPAFAEAFTRIVSHFFRHDAWLEEGQLLREAPRLAGIPGVIVQGRYDVMTPMITAWELKRRWRDVELVVVEGEGHSTRAPAMFSELVRATDRFSLAMGGAPRGEPSER